LKTQLSVFGGGIVFALGLALSGMTNANKIIGFFNLAGPWDPSLGFVMVGAVSVHYMLYRFVIKRKSPLFASHFEIPTRRDITPRLLAGSAVFGVGWGLGGFCPGSVLVAMGGLDGNTGVFVAAMLVGMLLHRGSSLVKIKPAKPSC
jgi:uncharacterized protein